MRVIPVIDLLGRCVVRGVAGKRREYLPISSRLVPDSRPGTLAWALVELFGSSEAYVADLDAIEHGRPDVAAWRSIAEAGLKLWLDPGIGTPAAGEKVAESLREFQVDATLVVGLESLADPASMTDLARSLGPERLAFSLDLKEGKPLVRIGWPRMAAEEIAQEAIDVAGYTRLIVLDLADVGVGGGPRTLDFCRRLRERYPNVELIAGGGVRGIGDLMALADAGCDAALVASALHDGRLTRGEIRQVENLTY